MLLKVPCLWAYWLPHFLSSNKYTFIHGITECFRHPSKAGTSSSLILHEDEGWDINFFLSYFEFLGCSLVCRHKTWVSRVLLVIGYSDKIFIILTVKGFAMDLNCNLTNDIFKFVSNKWWGHNTIPISLQSTYTVSESIEPPLD